MVKLHVMKPQEFALKSLRAVYTSFSKNAWKSKKPLDYCNQEANDYIKKQIEESKNGLMISKFGTYELETILYFTEQKKRFCAYKDFIKGRRDIFESSILKSLHNNAGFFPEDISLYKDFADLYLSDISQIDILGSYLWTEKYLDSYMKNCKRVNLEGYYAPFLWKNPWTKALENKKVLVVHPFTESIQKQYERRSNLFTNKDVLPTFADFVTVKAFQTNAGNKPQEEYKTWFDALNAMKDKISSKDFDVALIGCGAYGLPLAAHVKRMGKTAVHLAGWTQMLFGIYGNRWLNDQKQYAKYINEYWIRPSESERPVNPSAVENGCYW